MDADRRRAAVPLAALLAVVGGCQCFQPVDERPDAGVRDAGLADAGRPDAGLDASTPDAGGGFSADGGVECLTASDCVGTPWSNQWCFFGVDAGFSCVDRRCVSECLAQPRVTCVVDAGSECLECGGAMAICPLDTCGRSAFTATVSTVDCRPGVTPMLRSGEQLSFVPVRGASCLLSVSAAARGFGQVLRGNGRHAWFVRELGGWCLGEELPTGAIRSQVACPLCSFGVEGF